MKHLFLILSIAIALAANATEVTAPVDTIAHVDTIPQYTQLPDTTIKKPSLIQRWKNKMKDYQEADWDTTRDNRYWWRALKHGIFAPNDTTIHYPKFLKFCVKLYKWGDKTFNSYDTAYVVSTGKNWKLMIKNQNWLDIYDGRLTANRDRLLVNSEMNTTIGGQLSFMAVSLAYNIDIGNLFGGEQGKHSKWDFSFTCARFALEAYKSYNNGKSRLMRLGKYERSKFGGSGDFDGMERNSYGLNIYYIFNHNKYSQAAAYCFSKIQKRSAGSFIAGLMMSNQDIKIDFSRLKNSMKEYIPVDEQGFSIDNFRFHYREWNLIAGYAFNWVMGRNWLFNVTCMPSVGYKHCFESSIDGRRNLFSFNIRNRLGLVRNQGDFFYALQLNYDAHLYHSSFNNIFNSIIEINLMGGIRF